MVNNDIKHFYSQALKSDTLHSYPTQRPMPLLALSFTPCALPFALCSLVLLALDSAIRIPNSAFGTANFFMDDTCE
jgi:hypothetical protein